MYNMEKKKKGKKDKASKKGLGKERKEVETAGAKSVKTSEWDVNGETRYIEKDQNDDTLPNEMLFTERELGSEEINERKMKKEVHKLHHNGNKTNKRRSEMERCHTEHCKTNNGEDEDGMFPPSNEFKLTNLKNNEIFERNMPKCLDEISPLEKKESFAAEKGEGSHLKGLNKSVQFLKDMEGFKMRKQRMDDLVMNIGNKKEDNKGTPNGCDSLKDGSKGEVTPPLNIEEKETLSYKLKKQKKIEKYKLSGEEKDKYMKKYMLKLEKQYKKKKDEDLKKEVEEQKEEIKKYQEKENTILNYLKNPRLNLSKTEDLNDYLCISPTTVYFTDVAKDETMTRDLLITNKGSTLLHVIIVPPSTSHFHIKDIINVYNKNEENSKNNLNNQIAPGHSLKIKLGYSVFTLKHQRDQIKILSEAGNKTIDIKAFRSMPKLKFQKIFNFGPIRSHEKKKKSFYIKNEGQETNVLILPRKLFSFYEKKEKIEREENILNLLIKKKEDSKEAPQMGANNGAGKIIQVKEKEDTYYTFNSVKSYSQNFLYLYQNLAHNFENLYFENILQDCYYLNLKRAEEKVVTFAFRSGKIGVYEKDYLIVTDIECDFGELEDRIKCGFVNLNQMNVFPFCVKALVEPLLLNLVHINGNVPGEYYEGKVAEYLQGGGRDNLSYFFHSTSLHSIRFPDIQVNSGYNVAEVEVLNNGLIDLKVSCSVYVKANSEREEKQTILDKEDKGVYYYNEVFNVTCPHLLYDEVAEGKSSPKEEEREKGRKEKKKKKKKMCPVYIYPKKFTLSYKKRQKVYIIFKPQEKHENYKNYCFLLVVKNLSKGSDISIGDLLEIQKNGGEENDGFPLVCVRENKIIKNKKWNERFENDISKYEDSSSAEGGTCSSYSEISQDESLKKKQSKKKSYFGKKNKKKKFVAFCMNVYANIVKPIVHVKTKKLTKCLLLNPLHLYKTSFTIKNGSDFYVNYRFGDLIHLDGLSKGEKGISSDKRRGVIQGENTNALKVEERETPICGGIPDDDAGGKRKEEDPSADKEAYQICYYNYVDVLRDMRSAKKGGEKSTTEGRSGRSSTDRVKTKICEGGENRPDGSEVESSKAVDKKGNTDKGTDQLLSKKNVKGGQTSGEASAPPDRECFRSLNKRVIKYFYERGGSDAVSMYVLVGNAASEMFKRGEVERGGNGKSGKYEKNGKKEATLQREQREERRGGKNWTKKAKSKSVHILKVEEGEYCLKPHEKKKILLYFLVNHYGYHEMNMSVIFYMGKYMLQKNVKGRILTRCKGIEISRDSFFFRNSYSHYCFCNMVKIGNLDKDLKLIKLGQTSEKKCGFVTLYMLYLSAFKNKGKKRSTLKREDLLNHFRRNFLSFLENEIDKSCIKQEGDKYQCDLCRCSFKYDCCIHFFESKFLACTDGDGYSYQFGQEKYIVENGKMASLMEEPSRCHHLRDNLQGIYKHHANKDLYIHNSEAEFAAHLLMYPSNLLLLPLRETVFLFFVFLPHAGSVTPPLSINWNTFRRDILIEGECKNGSVKIKHDKRLGSTNPADTKRGKNYVGICSDTFHVKVKNLNELDISYEMCQEGNNEFEYNYHKKEYVVVWNCMPKLDCYYEDFYTFAKVNNVKRAKDKGFFCQNGEELKEEKHSCGKQEGAEYMEGGPLWKGEQSAEDGRPIHGCVIMADCHSNEVKGNKSKTHEFRLLLFHDDGITKDNNFVKLKFPVKLKYFHYREVIKVSCYFAKHTFDFVLMREEDLLLSLFSYIKMVVCDGGWCEKGATTCVGNEAKEEQGTKANSTDSFVDELMDELLFIKKEKKDDQTGGGTINEYFKQMKKFFPPNFDEDVLAEFQNFVLQMDSTFEAKEKQTHGVDGKGEEEKPPDEIIHQGGLNSDGDFPHGRGEHTNRRSNKGVEKLVWVHKLLHGLNNKVDYNFVNFVKRNKRELDFKYERGEITGEQLSSMKRDKINPAKMEEEKCHPPDDATNLFKSYCCELNRENGTIYVIVSNKNKYDLRLKLRSPAHIDDSLNEAFHLCIDNLIMRKEWPGISRFVSEYKLGKGETARCKAVNLDTLNCGKCSKLKHLSAAYKGKNEKKEDLYYQYLSNVLREKREYCFGLRSNFFVDFFQFENVLSSMKSSFVKVHLHADNVNLYEDKITLNLSKSERSFKMVIASQVKSLHLLSPHRETKNGDKCIFFNSIFINKEIFKKFEELNRNEKNEEVDKICKCFEEILKPREIDLFNSSNLRKRVHYTFSKIHHIRDEKGGRGKKGAAEGEAAAQRGYKREKQIDEDSNEKYEIRCGEGETTEDSSHLSDAADGENMSDEGREIRIEGANKYMDKNEKTKVKIFLENVLHKEGKHLYKIDCKYSYASPMDATSEVKSEPACDALNEKLRKLLSLQFYLSVNVEKPRIALLHNSKISYGKRVKFDFNYFNRKAYKRIDKMYKSEEINDILYEDVNKVNEYFDEVFLRNKNLKFYFCNQQDVPFYSYIYTKKFLQIKNVYIDHEEFDHSNTKIYHIKSKGKVCVKLEVDELKLKNELKNNPSRNLPVKNKIEKKYIQEDFLTFQYLTSKRQQRFCVECHYNVPFLIIKENQPIFREFNNLKRKNQKIENCKELNEIESNLSDKIKAGKIIYSEIEMRDSVYFISISFSELKVYKLCLFLFNTTRFPATWAVKEGDPSSGNSYSLKGADNKVFHFSKTKDILFGKTYDMHDVNLGKDENWNNPFLFPDYIIVTFTPTSKSDVTKKYFIDVADGEKVDFYLKGVYIPKNDEQTKNS
ncbi:conserved Plasmodium protein, unknown function [Plasmodium vivax]|uniref:Uncharacterized protein n=1 Tax=Plasmodium vivax TaxID=5855 RepID=A0A1G4H2I7_PLAVI|nr:conserved Plasmodium protein, unknown function [Plasmodium vivax]